MTKNRRSAWRASNAERAKADRRRRAKAELPPITERHDWVVRDLFPQTEPAFENRHDRRARAGRG
jgi:hypothetical protein